jgi:filamentous hemagglutinin
MINRLGPVAGRLPINHDYAGKAFPANMLPPRYRAKGVQFTPQGYPDFMPHAKQLPNGKKYVEIEYTGGRNADFAAANKKAGLDETPLGYTWHHVEDMRTMVLVPTDLHDAVKHAGGVSTYKHASGVDAYGS